MLGRKHFNSYRNLKDNNSSQMRNIIRIVDKKSELYQKENIRFIRDFEKKERKYQTEIKKKKNISLTKKMMFKKKNQNRYFSQRIEKERKEKDSFRKNILKKTNFGYDGQLMAINPITLKYYSNRKGKLLKEKNNYKKIREMIKSKNYEYKNFHSFNIINGKDHTNLVKIPKIIMEKYKKEFKPRKKLSTYRSYCF